MSAPRHAAGRKRSTSVPPTPPIAPEKETGIRRAIPDGPAPLVLIVDDAEQNREMYAEYLELQGLRVGHAVDGEHALLKVIRLMPAVIVMDLAMPVLDGWEATRRIREHPRTNHIPVIALTGHTLEESLSRAREAGADLVLTKPCTPPALLAAIRKLLKLAAHS